MLFYPGHPLKLVMDPEMGYRCRNEFGMTLFGKDTPEWQTARMSGLYDSIKNSVII